MVFKKYRLIKIFFLIALILSPFMGSSSIKARDLSTATLSATADAYMYSENIHQNYGNIQMISVVHAASPYGWGESVIKFDLSGVPAGSTIDSADMRLYLTACDITQGTITVKRMISNWTESTVNWAVRQDMHPTSAGSVQMVNPPCTQNSWYDFYITDIMKAWTGGSANYGVILTVPDSGTFSRGFNSKDSSGTNPQLIVDYYPPTSVPAGQADPSTGTQGSTSTSSTGGSTGSTSTSGSTASTTGSTATTGADGSVTTASADGQTELSKSSETGAVNKTKNFFQDLWNDPLLRIALIIGIFFFLAVVTVAIIMIVKYSHKKKIVPIKIEEPKVKK